MVKNAEKGDVLSDILNDTHDGFIKELESLNAIIESEGDGHSGTGRADKKTSSKHTRERSKKKTSHYLSRPVYKALNDAKVDLRDLLPDLPKSNLKKSEITKSNIVEIAVKTILEEYKEKGLQSTLIQKLTAKNESR